MFVFWIMLTLSQANLFFLLFIWKKLFKVNKQTQQEQKAALWYILSLCSGSKEHFRNAAYLSEILINALSHQYHKTPHCPHNPNLNFQIAFSWIGRQVWVLEDIERIPSSLNYMATDNC